MLPEWKGYLYVLGLDVPFSQMKVTKELKAYDKKIIECFFENGQWKMLRQRVDKSYPNAYETAMSICGCIKNPITKEFLLEFVKHRAKKPRCPPKADARPCQCPLDFICFEALSACDGFFAHRCDWLER
ncbi:unnamed protein product [Soboliphyme baturini]|uniref:mRNA_cap_C domain-containing protein n=1 Tax=Soboliphyme baturini TaxID=241478 RepID=A0A183IPM1_9BILA|nr:unnamed protein product [Soboliphyme baturini]